MDVNIHLNRTPSTLQYFGNQKPHCYILECQGMQDHTSELKFSAVTVRELRRQQSHLGKASFPRYRFRKLRSLLSVFVNPAAVWKAKPLGTKMWDFGPLLLHFGDTRPLLSHSRHRHFHGLDLSVNTGFAANYSLHLICGRHQGHPRPVQHFALLTSFMVTIVVRD